MKKLLSTIVLLAVTFTVYAQSCPDNNHPHMIDLGLPSGTMWACCNVADDPAEQTPTRYGGYYAWGEMQPKKFYEWERYSFCKGSIGTCQDIGNDIAGTQYDIAHMKWGGSWVLPSKDQLDELRNNCASKWITVDGISGKKITGKNGKSIFLPAAGFYHSIYRQGRNVIGVYFSSTQYSRETCYILTVNEKFLEVENGDRCNGFNARPVNIAKLNSKGFLLCPDDNHPHMIDLGLPSGTKWACCNLGSTNPESHGDYYAWGEMQMKDLNNWSTYKYSKATLKSWKKIGCDIAGTKYDVANLKSSGSCLMPSKEQMYELISNCTYQFTRINNVPGGRFTGKNGKSIFLPAAGNSWYYGRRDTGYYWSSTMIVEEYQGKLNFDYAWCLDFSHAGRPGLGAVERCIGNYIRPVSK